MSYFNVSDLKDENLTNFYHALSISGIYFVLLPFLMIAKVT